MEFKTLDNIHTVKIRLVIFLCIPTFCIAGNEEPDKAARKSEIVKTAVVDTEAVDVVELDQLKIFPVSPGTQVNRVIVGDGSGSVAGSSAKLVYSNTLGIVIAQVPPHRLIADDLSLNAPFGCELSRFTFQVVGRANPDHIGGPFRVDYALYEYCPGAGGPVISGTQGFVEFADAHDDMIQQVEIGIPADQLILLPPNIWLGLKTSRDNVGIIMGAPPLIGFSEDILDFSGFACNTNIGGFPSFGHASYNAEVYVRGQCPDAFTGYRNKKSFNAGVNHGTNVIITSNIELGVESCEMVGYEVGVRGPALYTVELRNDNNGVPGKPIEGTKKLFVHNENTFRPQSFYFDPPIYLDKNIWITIKIGNDIGGWVSTVFGATIGRTIDGAYRAMVTCAGQPPVGACCDMYIGECTSGHDKGKPCRINDDCKHPGTCEAVCRQVPEMNCSFPTPRGLNLQPKWMEGIVCDPDPFPFTCGAAACCKPDNTCENLTRNECDDVEPVDDSRQWHIGKYCGEQQQECPYVACLGRVGDCVVARPETGCEIPLCCGAVCNADPFCCEVEWDRFCAIEAIDICRLIPPNDDCFNPREGHGALLVASDSSTVSSSSYATTNETDPGFCCNQDEPGGKGHQTLWYKFIAEHEYATLTAYAEPAINNNIMIQVFSAFDLSSDETACNSLIPIECNEPYLKDLIRGKTYYILIASKISTSSYRLTIDSPGGARRGAPENDLCEDAEVVTDGSISIGSFGLRNASSTCPIDDCGKIITHDLWYEYTSNCTGRLFVTPCRPDIYGPEIVVLYKGCNCPVNSSDVVMCTGDNNNDDPGCFNTEPSSIDTTAEQCYKVRVGGSLLNNTAGNRSFPKFDCAQCDPGKFTWNDPPSGVVDARRPHPFLPCFDDGSCPTVRLSNLEGIRDFNVSTPAVVHKFCMDVQQTNRNEDLHTKTCCPFSKNTVFSLDANENDSRLLKLNHKLQSGEITTINYSDNDGAIQTGEFIALPGDVNGDRMVCVDDVRELLDIVKGLKQPVWGNFSADIDHSGSIHPADILQLIDLMNGAGAYAPWQHATVLTADVQCPGQ